jgi:type III pantothenate kinase
VSVDPERVGLDRLLNAIAAKDRVKREVSIFIVDAGSAVTVDWVDEFGVFRGGAIFPGFPLMTKALHDYTAKLPLIHMTHRVPSPVGTCTEKAMESGVFWAVAGGIKAILRQMAEFPQKYADEHTTLSSRPSPVIFLTGGDAKTLAATIGTEVILWPEMTLEGIRIAAEALP